MKTDHLFREEVRSALNAETIFRKEREVTAGAGATELWAEDMPTNSAWIVSVVVNGYGAGQRGMWERRAKFSRDEAGASLLNSDTIGTDYESDAALAVALSASGNGPLLTVDPAAYDMKFRAVIKISEVR